MSKIPGESRLKRMASSVRTLVSSLLLTPAALMITPALAQTTDPEPETAQASVPVGLITQCGADLKRFGSRLFSSEAEARDYAETLDEGCIANIVHYDGMGYDATTQYIRMDKPARVATVTDPDQSPDAGLGNVDMTTASQLFYNASAHDRRSGLSSSINVDASVDVLGPLYLGANAGMTNGTFTYGGFAGVTVAKGLSAQLGYGKTVPAQPIADLNTSVQADRTYMALNGSLNFTTRDVGLRLTGLNGGGLREGNAFIGVRRGAFSFETQGVMGRAQNLMKTPGLSSSYKGITGGVYYGIGEKLNLRGLVAGPEMRLNTSRMTSEDAPRFGINRRNLSLGLGVRYEDREAGAYYALGVYRTRSSDRYNSSIGTKRSGMMVGLTLFSPISFGGRRAQAVAYNNSSYRTEVAQREEANAQILRRQFSGCVIVEDTGAQISEADLNSRCEANRDTAPPLVVTAQPRTVPPTSTLPDADIERTGVCNTAGEWEIMRQIYNSRMKTGTVTASFEAGYRQCERKATTQGFNGTASALFSALRNRDTVTPSDRPAPLRLRF